MPARQPLDVTASEPGGGPERVGMVDEALADIRHSFEAPMRVLGEARHDASVVHAPAVGTGEIHPEIARLEWCGRAHVLVGSRVAIQVVDAEEEWVGRAPLPAKGNSLQNRIIHLREPNDVPRPPGPELSGYGLARLRRQ
jgi:hypothetical protein